MNQAIKRDIKDLKYLKQYGYTNYEINKAVKQIHKSGTYESLDIFDNKDDRRLQQIVKEYISLFED
jgi:hypothetical protein